MESNYIHIFQTEVKNQCEFAITALQEMQTSLNQNNLNKFWYSVHGFLTAIGNISKLLWPKDVDCRKELRESLNVHDFSSLQPRTFRNHFEHFDERIERWIKDSKSHNFADRNISTPGGIVGLEDTDFMRNFDPQNNRITFQGEVYDLNPIVGELNPLYKKALEESNKPPWEKKDP